MPCIQVEHSMELGTRRSEESVEICGFCKALAAIFLFLVSATMPSTAQATFTSLFAFNNADGATPYYEYLVQGTDGQLYGTAESGGNNGAGTVYKITTTGTFTQLYTFCSLTNCADGDFPVGGLVLARNGNFYGTTSNTNTSGGSAWDGTIFEITSTGVLTVLHTFTGTDGSLPYSNMIQGGDGNLYGTTLYGGNLSLCNGIGCGTIFKITPAGKFTSLHTFSANDGQWPIGRLFQGNNGNFYGTTINGGAYGYGTVYEIAPGGKLTTLYNFNNTSANPYGGVIQTANGTVYGTSAYGGSNSAGTIFKLVGRKLTTLYNFCSVPPNCADGNYPYGGLIQASDGNLYGTTLGSGPNVGGTVFEFILPSTINTLYSFCSQPSCSDGNTPYGGGLLQATDGNFYGTTVEGGDDRSDGTVFKISTGLGPFVQALTNSGKVGTPITILGTNLNGATTVSFNSAAATFTVGSGGTYITTSVPAGATTGNITVTTPGGTLSTTAAFKVIPQIKTFTPPSGLPGTVVTITGVSLTQASKVTFGGVAATSFTVNSDTQVTATVPTGAKTGKIRITTPGGTASSATNFTVT